MVFRTGRLLRWLFRLTILMSILSISLFVTDIWLDFLPSSLQTRLPLHPDDPIIIDIEISTCHLLSQCKAPGSDWLRLPKDLYLGESWTRQGFIYYKQINEDALPQGQLVVTKVATGSFNSKNLQATVPTEVYDDISKKGDDSELEDPAKALLLANEAGWQLKDAKAGLWVKYERHVPNKALTGLKLLFGEDATYPVPSWDICDGQLGVGLENKLPRLVARRGRPVKQPRPELRFDKNGKFKIVQIADLHMSTGFGECDHPVPPVQDGDVCLADRRTTNFVDDVLNEEKPDYVVFTGDQIFGQTSPDPETALLKALAPVLERGIPFSVVWGNHDEQGSLRNSELMNIVLEMPDALVEHGPEDVPGDGNYILTVSPHGNDLPALSMFFLDSHAKLPAKGGGYDYIRPEQLDFVRKGAEGIRQRLKTYSHIPLSMAFFHIPLPEYRDGQDGGDNAPKRIGTQREAVMSSRINSGTLDVLREVGVSILTVGHDHVNDYCQLQEANEPKHSIWLCYGGSGGFGAYGGYPDSEGHDYERRIRVFNIDMNLPAIDTWHRVQDEANRINQSRLVSNGEARFTKVRPVVDPELKA